MTPHRQRVHCTTPTGHSVCQQRRSQTMSWVCGWLTATVVALAPAPARATEDPIDVPVTRGKVDLGGLKPALPTMPGAGTPTPSANTTAATTAPPPTKPRPRTVADYAAEAKAKAAAEAAAKTAAGASAVAPPPPLLAPVVTPASAPTPAAEPPVPAPPAPPKVAEKPPEKPPARPTPTRPGAKPALDEGLDKVAIKLMEAMARASAKQDQRETNTRTKPNKATPTETVLAEKPATQPSAHWGYEGPGGPENWGQLKPEFNTCAVGQRQSPIAIDSANTLQGPAEPLGFDYRPSEGSVVHNGHTIQVDLNPTNTLNVRGSQYQLQQVHFHHPGETTVNGTTFAMSAHLVHQNAEGQLAVVAVLLTPGEANPAVDTVWKYMPVDRGDRVKLPTGALNPPDLLPKDQRYYQFMGSLTTPPCTEGVLWMVLKTPVTLSPGQIRLFGQLFPHNARPVQPVNGRPVREAL